MGLMKTLEPWTWRVGLLVLLALLAVNLASDTRTHGAGFTPVAMAMTAKAKAQRVDPKQGAALDDVWKPAATPRGGVSWKVLEATKEITRKDNEGYIVSKPVFPRQVRELEGKRVKVAGWMMPLEAGARQSRFVLLAYPPGCPFHFHAAPMQFIEVIASTPFKTDEVNAHTVSGVLELTGFDESGIFYRLKNARPI
ncbi:MAG: DUF3299 domain-containing protein [Erythrobacter sp.]|jgi:hypothetical protein|nr:DUF3299 domain-containing protein [Erythrobacter sp.]